FSCLCNNILAFLFFKAKEKRGWTLNSAGYLLGPHAVDNHRSFNDKHGFTGKREIQPDEDIKAGNDILKASIVELFFMFSILFTVIELTYYLDTRLFLHLTKILLNI
uniref:Galanin and GMAP prepropeptide n=1 Tax=Calidris pygmaea TaxID=425635 RepID=A0A8C3JNI5_9CHAR